MRQLVRLWPALEAIPGTAAVEAQWRELLDGEYDVLMPYLQPAATLAASFPRLGGGYQGLPYSVVEHGPDDYAGVCPDSGDVIALIRSDLVVYELDCRRLTRSLATALGFRHQDDAPAGLPPATHLVGAYQPCAGYSFPVYLTIPLESRTLTRTICALVAAGEQPFVLLAPTDRRLQADGRAVLERKKACFVDLSQALAIADSGALTATGVAGRILERFRQAHLPAPTTANGATFFPTPASATWGDLSVRIVDGETVAVKVGGIGGTYLYAQMGMADGRNAKPTKQWDFLRDLARVGGVMTWRSRGADRKNKKRRELLARDLKAFFRIDGEPIVLTDDGKGWRTVFRLEPDA